MTTLACRGIRGATTIEENSHEKILQGTSELLLVMQAENSVPIDEMVSIVFTATPDLDVEFPAVAARNLGWTQVPLLCCSELAKPDGLSKCIRVLMHVNTPKTQKEIRHIYLRKAKDLRQDLF